MARTAPKSVFKKGHIPWNKGMKTGLVPKSAFVESHIPWNKNFNKSNCMLYAKMSKSRSGKNHWNWKGGISSIRECIYQSSEYKQWRKAVFERDNYTCQKCGQYNGYLEPHHLFRFADFPELRFEIWNGVTLCYDCHNGLGRQHATPKTNQEVVCYG